MSPVKKSPLPPTARPTIQANSVNLTEIYLLQKVQTGYSSVEEKRHQMAGK